MQSRPMNGTSDGQLTSSVRVSTQLTVSAGELPPVFSVTEHGEPAGSDLAHVAPNGSLDAGPLLEAHEVRARATPRETQRTKGRMPRRPRYGHGTSEYGRTSFHSASVH